ncbi:MAG: helix-turn-helix domain-containing protein [Pseudomonadota bacterium]
MEQQPRADTHDRIIHAADALFYAGSIRDVSVDRIAEMAGVTKKTLYYHFRSKDDLVAAYLAARHKPTLERYKSWAGESGPMPDRIERMFRLLSEAARNPGWKGCGFIRAAVELADSPGHPALEAARRYKAAFADWLQNELDAAGYEASGELCMTIMILLDGAIARMMVDRDPNYAITAGKTASKLLATAD